jgi:hypothetical protein
MSYISWDNIRRSFDDLSDELNFFINEMQFKLAQTRPIRKSTKVYYYKKYGAQWRTTITDKMEHYYSLMTKCQPYYDPEDLSYFLNKHEKVLHYLLTTGVALSKQICVKWAENMDI